MKPSENFLWLEDNGKKVDIIPSDNSEGISINASGDVQLFTPSQESLPKNRDTIFMVIGVIDLHSIPHVLAVTHRTLMGKIDGNQIWRIQKVKIVPVGQIKESDEKLVKNYTEMLLGLLNTGDFYYSHTYDLTNSLQRQRTDKNVTTDHRFYWNRFVHKRFDGIPENHKIKTFFCPIIQGFVNIKTDCKIGQGKTFDYALVSRRSCKRTGVRFESRGANLEGDVANFVETEQIISVKDEFSSFLQVRGSIPIVWEQKTNVKYDPPILVNDIKHSKRAFTNHFDEQLKLYNKQTVVSLIKEKGSEKKLGDVFNSLMQQYNNNSLKYHTFDLHHICGTSKFQKLSLLFDKIDSDIDSYGFYVQTDKSSSQQGGIIRTNCKDSLDRTNLVQSKIALKVFWKQAQAMGVVPRDSTPDADFETILRHVWADNGDAISVQYAGTPAVRGDVTRTGKGSIKGLINDGLNSITRYYLNNFQDGNKQDSIDLFLGKTKLHAQVKKSSSSQENSGFLVMFIASLLFLFALFKPTPTSSGSLNVLQYLILFFWLPIIFLVSLILSLFNKKVGYRMTSRARLSDHVEDFEK